MVVEGLGVGAGEAEALVVAVDEAVEVDAFVAEVAGDSLAFEAGELVGRERDSDPGGAEEVFVGEVAVGLHLLRIFFEAGVEGAGSVFGGFEGYDAEGFVVVGCVGEFLVEVDEGGGHLAEVAELEGSLADAAAGDDSDGVCRTAVDFYEGDQALAVGVEGTVGEMAGAGVVDAEAIEGEHGHADAEDLAGAEMAVGLFGVLEERVERRGHRGQGSGPGAGLSCSSALMILPGVGGEPGFVRMGRTSNSNGEIQGSLHCVAQEAARLRSR